MRCRARWWSPWSRRWWPRSSSALPSPRDSRDPSHGWPRRAGGSPPAATPGAGTWPRLRRETSRLARIVDDLQELWRAEARQLPVTLEVVDVASLLVDGAERFATLAGERSITVRIDAPAGLPAARADGARLGQALENLLSNAIPYPPDASEIVVAAPAPGGG